MISCEQARGKLTERNRGSSSDDTDPFLKFPPDADPREVIYHQKIKWPNDIARHREHINIIEGVIDERADEK